MRSPLSSWYSVMPSTVTTFLGVAVLSAACAAGAKATRIPKHAAGSAAWHVWLRFMSTTPLSRYVRIELVGLSFGFSGTASPKAASPSELDGVTANPHKSGSLGRSGCGVESRAAPAGRRDTGVSAMKSIRLLAAAVLPALLACGCAGMSNSEKGALAGGGIGAGVGGL